MAKKVRINFKGVDKEIKKGGGGGKHIPEGEYLVKIVSGEVKDSERSGAKYISWKFQVVNGEHKGVTLYGNTSLKPEALWSLRNLIHAATGKNVAGKALDLDLEKLYGKIVGADVTDNEYKDKIRSQVNTCFPKDEVSDESDDEDEDSDDEEEEDDEEEDLEEVDVETL